MNQQDPREQIRENLRQQVGGFFTNAARGPALCSVCTGPADDQRCYQCERQHAEYGDQLADQTIIFAYAKEREQSGHHMYGYKRRISPSLDNLRDLKLMMLGGTFLHGDCIAQAFGWWEAITFVSSASRPELEHPVVELAKQVVHHGRDPDRVLLGIGPDIDAAPSRFPLPHRFTVDEVRSERVADKHVLVVDDTWVSGDKSQSAALALKAAGARAVTILCIARWLSPTYNFPHQDLLIKASRTQYDALVCPVTGASCPVPRSTLSAGGRAALPVPTTPAGWYPDPYQQPNRRWWNGYRWTDVTAPNPPAG
jgi:hypothetical protein